LNALHQIVDGLSLDTEVDIHLAMNRASSDDALLNDLMAFLMREPKSAVIAQSSFAMICYFFVDSNQPFLRDLAQSCIEEIEGVEARNSILSERLGDLAGLELADVTRRQFVVFTPESGMPGMVRFSFFDQAGFFDHATFDGYAEALKAAWMAGFRQNVSGTLNQFCLTDTWRRGMEQTWQIQQRNLNHVSRGCAAYEVR